MLGKITPTAVPTLRDQLWDEASGRYLKRRIERLIDEARSNVIALSGNASASWRWAPYRVPKWIERFDARFDMLKYIEDNCLPKNWTVTKITLTRPKLGETWRGIRVTHVRPPLRLVK